MQSGSNRPAMRLGSISTQNHQSVAGIEARVLEARVVARYRDTTDFGRMHVLDRERRTRDALSLID
jgi:hypothetical protein